MYVYIYAQEKLKGSCQTLNSSRLRVVGLGVGNIEDSMFTYYLQSLFSFMYYNEHVLLLQLK